MTVQARLHDLDPEDDMYSGGGFVPFPLRQVEYFPEVRDEKPPREDLPPEDTGAVVDQSRTQAAIRAGVDPMASATGTRPATTAGQNIGGGPPLNGGKPKTVTDESLPGGKADLQPDGSLKPSKGDPIEVGERGQNPITASASKPKRSSPADSEPTSQHSPENKKAAMDRILDKVGKAAMAVPLLLPLSLLLAGMIQGLIDCDQLDGKAFGIKSVDSAASPKYPDGTPDWIKNTFTMNKTQVDLTYSPCVKILSNDSITVKNSNVFDGEYTPTGTSGSCKVRIDIGKPYVANTFANTAIFNLSTSCEDRMAYEIGHDIGELTNFAAQTTGDILGATFGNMNWSTIFLVLFGIVAVFLAFQVIKIFKG